MATVVRALDDLLVLLGPEGQKLRVSFYDLPHYFLEIHGQPPRGQPPPIERNANPTNIQYSSQYVSDATMPTTAQTTVDLTNEEDEPMTGTEDNPQDLVSLDASRDYVLPEAHHTPAAWAVILTYQQIFGRAGEARTRLKFLEKIKELKTYYTVYGLVHMYLSSDLDCDKALANHLCKKIGRYLNDPKKVVNISLLEWSMVKTAIPVSSPLHVLHETTTTALADHHVKKLRRCQRRQDVEELHADYERRFTSLKAAVSNVEGSTGKQRTARRVDVRTLVDHAKSRLLFASDMENWEMRHGQIPEGGVTDGEDPDGNANQEDLAARLFSEAFKTIPRRRRAPSDVSVDENRAGGEESQTNN